jgi:hypothetical protein
VNAQVRSLAFDKNGDLYIGGDFTTAGGSGMVGIAKWDTSAAAFVDLGDVADGSAIVRDVGITPDGRVYILGSFTSVGGVSATNAAYWNGGAWSALAGMPTTAVNNMAVRSNGNVIFSGSGFAPSPLFTSGAAEWTGSTWIPADLDVFSGGIVSSFTGDIQYEYFGMDNTVSTLTAASNAITVQASNTTPTLRVTGPGRLYAIKNVTTNSSTSFIIDLLAGEIATLKFGNKPTFTSNFRGDISSTILPGGSPATWYLQNGVNYVTMFYYGFTGDAAASLIWREQYDSLDGSTP